MRKTPQRATPSAMQDLLGQLRELIASARTQALRAVDVIQVRTCWEIGRHIVEFEQGGAIRADYGSKLIPNLAATLTAEFGKGFDERNLRNMRGFFQSLSNLERSAFRIELDAFTCHESQRKSLGKK